MYAIPNLQYSKLVGTDASFTRSVDCINITKLYIFNG